MPVTDKTVYIALYDAMPEYLRRASVAIDVQEESDRIIQEYWEEKLYLYRHCTGHWVDFTQCDTYSDVEEVIKHVHNICREYQQRLQPRYGIAAKQR